MKILIVLLLNFCLMFGFSAKVVKVSDGDTISVLTEDKKQIRIRLYGIDAPELKQSFGRASKSFLSNKIAGKIVLINQNGKDRYSRILATVYLEDEDINAYMVDNGYAWAFEKYSKRYMPQQSRAKFLKLGLWQQSDPITPWDFRKIKKSKE
ncbi:thermonuclease family protein [Campylobacter sp. RM16191]|uniref:thermonuclease family protein n=1 Tax=Campylobacter sp. RM16191 TaxID=1705728 RepID=UPI001476611A|nr:thermonuclease family protein [Campylobacter sp. RM16191]